MQWQGILLTDDIKIEGFADGSFTEAVLLHPPPHSPALITLSCVELHRAHPLQSIIPHVRIPSKAMASQNALHLVGLARQHE